MPTRRDVLTTRFGENPAELKSLLAQALGVKLVYHNHMGNVGERPEAAASTCLAPSPLSRTWAIVGG